MEIITLKFIKTRIREQQHTILVYSSKLDTAIDEATKERLHVQLQSAHAQLEYFRELLTEIFNDTVGNLNCID